MKILVTGSSGMLAADIIKRLREENHEVIQTDIKPRMTEMCKLDVSSFSEVFKFIPENLPHYIFHLAAETNVDLCQQEINHAYKVNTLGTENIALACLKYDIPLVYISTGSVFPGDKPTPYTEFDTPGPINVYAQTKLQGEIIIRGLLNKHFIVRAGWVIGGWELDKKFVYKVVQQIKSGQRQLNIVSDKLGSPTFTDDFARNLVDLIKTERYGLYHMANKGTCSRYQIALKIVEFLGVKDTVKVNPISSNEFPLPAPRPNSEMLDNFKLDLLGLNNMPYWEESLEKYIKLNKDK